MLRRTLLLTMMILTGGVTGCALGLGGPPRLEPVWVSDLGDGRFQNPVIFADYSDPDAVRVGDDFYMTASSFTCAPGLPILHSRDLVNWELIGHVFQQHPFPEFDVPQHGKGVWAPSIRYHEGTFYVCYGDPDHGILMATATDPAGPWDGPHLIKEGKGLIDPCPFWDDDGQAYLVHGWAKSRAGINSILTMYRMSPDGSELLDDGEMVFDGRETHVTIEGPKMYKRDGWYWLFAPYGGVAQGSQVVLRSRNVFGPYEPKTVLEQGSTEINGPHQGAWIELDSGQDWFIHFQERGHYGRIIHMQRMGWDAEGWPTMGADLDGNGVGEPLLAYPNPDVGAEYPIQVPVTTDEFEDPALGLQWQWQGNWEQDWFSLTDRPGAMRLHAVPRPESAEDLRGVPAQLLQKLPAPEFAVTTLMHFEPESVDTMAGLVVMGNQYSGLIARRSANGLTLERRTYSGTRRQGENVVAAVDGLTGPIYLRMVCRPEHIVSFSYSQDGKHFEELGPEFMAYEGGWIGAKMGILCAADAGSNSTEHADFEWFRVHRIDQDPITGRMIRGSAGR